MPSKEEYFDPNYPSPSNCHWFPWLQKKLILNGILTQTPEMPQPYQPDYKQWKKEFEQFTIDQNTTLIGHSCGGGFLVRYLSENKTAAHKLILVAPWLDPEREETTTFFDFTIDSSIQDRIQEIHILLSDNEELTGIKESVEIIQKALPKAKFHLIQNMGHFCLEDMKTNEFPKLLELILS